MKEQNDEKIKYAFYCDALEEQYDKAKIEGVFKILELLELDKAHSDSDIVRAVDYYRSKDGMVEKDAPLDFLNEHAKMMVNKDGNFRPRLYCMLLSQSLSEALQNKTVFMMH